MEVVSLTLLFWKDEAYHLWLFTWCNSLHPVIEVKIHLKVDKNNNHNNPDHSKPQQKREFISSMKLET